MAGTTAKTLGEMLKATLAKEIAGFWQGGGSAGDWWLRGSAPQDRRR